MDKNRFLIYCTVFLIMGLSNSVIPVLPEIASFDSQSVGTLTYTLLFSGYFIGALLTMIPFGFVADIYSYLRLVVFSIFLTFFAGTILLFSENIHLLIIARFIEGVACGAFFPAAYAMLSEFQEKKRYIGEFNFLLNAGLALGVASAGFLAPWSIKGSILLFTILSFFILIYSIYLIMTNKTEKAGIIKKVRFPDVELVKNKIINTDFLRIWIIAFLLFGISGLMLAFYPEYARNILTKPELGIAIATLYISSMITNILVGRMSLQFRTMIYSGILIAATGILISVKFPFLGFALVGIGSGTGMIGLPVAVSNMPFDRGLAMGILNTYTYAGLAFMPMIAGMFIGFGYPTMVTLAALVMILSLLLKDGIKSES
ncbi:MAG: MFS transporter [Methanolobus sp.]|nr:MFS transporter [Methanolobus sp.]